MKNILIQKIILFIVISFSFESCSGSKDLSYMKDIDKSEMNSTVLNKGSQIQVGDQLGIWISAQDMDAVAPFNQNIIGINNAQFSQPSSNIQQSQMGGQIPTYLVQTNGTIRFPIIGELYAIGLTVEEFQQNLTQKMEKYIKNPSVQVRILNYKITILGEVNQPGTYTIPDGQATILSALGLAGDLTKYAVRKDVLLVRNENGKMSKQRIDLTSKSFIDSPYYFLKQNDVIYVNPNKTIARQANLDPNNGIYLSLVSILVTIIALMTR